MNGAQVVYAIMPHCSGSSADDVVTAASHELNEASTDPFPDTNTAYAGFDGDHLSYEFFNAFQDELGDACEQFQTSYFTTTETAFTFPVQRQWSNASAAAGHDPCVPAMAAPFYSVTLFPADEDAISVDLTSLMAPVTMTKGFKLALNESRTFQVGFFSDAATSGPWTISAIVDPQLTFPDQNGNAINNGTATVSIDKTSGVNGEKANVTVTPTAFNSLGTVFIYLRSALPERRRITTRRSS